MKAIKFLGMLFAAAALSFTATSCGEDKDLEQILDEIEQGTIKPTASIKKSSNELVLTIKYPSFYTEVNTAKFSNGKLVSFTMVDTYASNKLADAAWDEILKEGHIEVATGLKRDNKTITWDLTELMSDMDYEEVLLTFEARKYALEHGEEDRGRIEF